MKSAITIILLSLLTLSLIAKPKQKKIASKVTLKYNPIGQIIKFNFEGNSIITDTGSLFFIYSNNYAVNSFWGSRNNEIKQVIEVLINNYSSDTIIITDSIIPKTLDYNNQLNPDWYIDWAIYHLTTEKRVVIFDKQNQKVKTVKIKIKEIAKGNYNLVQYTNKKTKTLLFEEKLHKPHRGHPRF